MSAFLSPIGNSGVPFFTQQGVVLAGGQLYTYLAGTTTPQATWATPAQSVQNANPIVLNSAGLPPQEIWLQQGTAYKFVLQDAQGNTLQTLDNISGINDTSVSVSEWVLSNLTPTFVSGTQFTVPGNQTAALNVGRRVKASVSAGTVYGTITASVFTTLTTVTLALDSGALDSGLSAVSYGLLSGTNSSVPVENSGSAKVSAYCTNTQSISSGGTQVIGAWSTNFDQLSNFNASTGVFTVPTAGFYQVCGSLQFASASRPAGQYIAIILKNGSEYYASEQVTQATATNFTGTSVSGLLKCAAGDTISLGVFQDTGGPAALSGNATKNFMTIAQIA